MIADAQAHQSDDKKKKELAELRNNADGAHLHHGEEPRGVRQPAVGEGPRGDQGGPREAQGACSTPDDPRAQGGFQRLEGSAYRIADAIYADQAKSGS